MRDKLGRFIKGVKKKPFTKTHKLNMSKAKRGKNNPLYKVKPSKETLLKRSRALKGKTPWNKGKKWPEKSGANAPGWKGGVSTEHEILRHSMEYKLWRTAVFERDNYTCIWCGTRGGELNADHIKPFALFPELRFAIDNGRTLCVDCHKTTPTYAKKINLEDKCFCYIDCKPGSFIPVLDVRNPYCMKCGKSIL